MAMALRFIWRVMGLTVFTLVMGYIWLAASFDRPRSWIVLLPLVALVAFWIYWILGCWPKRLVLLRRCVLTGALLAALPLLVEYVVIRPITAKQQRIEGTRRAHEAALAKALEQHECPEGRMLVVVPWVTLVSVEGNRQLVELLLLSSDRATWPIFLARTTAHSGLHLDLKLEELRSEIESCFELPQGLHDLLSRMEQGDFDGTPTD
jgi:hypothetical protein